MKVIIVGAGNVGMGIGRRLPALVDAGDVFRFGRNEMGNQNLHRWLDVLVDA